MTWKILLFKTPMELQTYLNTGKSGGAFATGDVKFMYFDAVSGHHVVAVLS
jgi:hypothetical protein